MTYARRIFHVSPLSRLFGERDPDVEKTNEESSFSCVD